LCLPRSPLPPFLLRVCLEDVWRWATFRGRDIVLQGTGDETHVIIRYHGKMRHDIANFPEGTGARLGPGVRWQGDKVLLQPLEFSLEDCDTFYLGGHGVSLLAIAWRTNRQHCPLCIRAQAWMFSSHAGLTLVVTPIQKLERGTSRGWKASPGHLGGVGDGRDTVHTPLLHNPGAFPFIPSMPSSVH